MRLRSFYVGSIIATLLASGSVLAESVSELTADLDTPKASVAKKLQYDFYNENVYLDKAQHTTTDLRGRVYMPLMEKVRAYGGFEYVKDWNEEKSVAYSDEYVAPLLGINVNILGPLNLWAEYRQLYRDNSGPIARKETEGDPRVGLTYFEEFNLFNMAERVNMTNETYGETFWIPRVRDPGEVSTVWSKILLNFRLTRQSVTLSPYGELYYNDSPTLELGQNNKEARAGLRLAINWTNNLSSKLMVYRGTSLNSKNLQNPTQAMLVIGGQL